MNYKDDEERTKYSDNGKLLDILGHVIPYGYNEKKINEFQLRDFYWCVLENCEAEGYILHHNQMFNDKYLSHSHEKRVKYFIKYFTHG